MKGERVEVEKMEDTDELLKRSVPQLFKGMDI